MKDNVYLCFALGFFSSSYGPMGIDTLFRREVFFNRDTSIVFIRHLMFHFLLTVTCRIFLMTKASCGFNGRIGNGFSAGHLFGIGLN
jgi:hypothetical protein